jgi:hypothetical protein
MFIVWILSHGVGQVNLKRQVCDTQPASRSNSWRFDFGSVRDSENHVEIKRL